MVSCHDVADYILSLTDEESGDIISHLKLQKLVYYAQGFHLAMYNKPLFNEHIEAWTHGPVVRELYNKYKAYGAGAIPVPTQLDNDRLNEDIKELINEVYSVYGQYSAWKLRDLTHAERPWKEANENSSSCIISQETMKSYFKTLLVSNEQKEKN